MPPTRALSLNKRLGLCALAAVSLLATTATAGAQSRKPAPLLHLRGPLIQGGLIVGRVAPGSRVTLGGKALRVSADGRFAFGLGRDAKPTARLGITYPSGMSQTRVLTIRQRRYRITRLTVPKRFVEVPPELMKRLEKEYFLILNARKTASKLPYFAHRFVWPTIGRVTGIFGSQRVLNGKPRRPHYGLDIAAPRGAPIRAAQAGQVIVAHPGLYFSGKTVLVDHGHGLSTVYIHMSKIVVATGDRVRRGQLLGRVGTTGRSTGPHLHWGLHWHQLPLDPRLVVGPMPRPTPRRTPKRKAKRR